MNFKRIMAYILATSVAVSTCACARTKNTKNNVNYEIINEDLLNEISELKSQNSYLESENTKLQGEINTLEEKNEELQAKLDKNAIELMDGLSKFGDEHDKEIIEKLESKDENLSNCLNEFLQSRCSNVDNYYNFATIDKYNLFNYKIIDNFNGRIKELPRSLCLLKKNRVFVEQKEPSFYGYEVYELYNSGHSSNIYVVTYTNDFYEKDVRAICNSNTYTEEEGIHYFDPLSLSLTSLPYYLKEFGMNEEFEELQNKEFIVTTDEFVNLLMKMSKKFNYIVDTNLLNTLDINVIDTTNKDDLERLDNTQDNYFVYNIGTYLFNDEINVYEDIENNAYSFVYNDDITDFRYVNYSEVYNGMALYSEGEDGVVQKSYRDFADTDEEFIQKSTLLYNEKGNTLTLKK